MLRREEVWRVMSDECIVLWALSRDVNKILWLKTQTARRVFRGVAFYFCDSDGDEKRIA